MALRWDLLKNIGNNIQEGASNVLNKIRYANAPTLPVLQMADNGEVDLQKSLELSMAQPKTLKDNLLGRTFTINSEAKNPETGELEVSQVSKFQPGLLNDIRSGARENFATGFAAPNWEQTKTPDGRNKGLGYRFGEGVGSLAKFAETPLGRGLIMAGIVGAAGGSGLEALGYGAGAGLANQQNRMKDKLYRDNLIRQRQDALKADKNFQLLDAEEQQAMLDAIAKEINSIRGYLGDTPYKNMVNAQIAQDNADYKRLYLDSQKKNQEVAEQLAKDKFEYTKQQDAIENAQRWAQINKSDQQKPLSDSQVEKINTAQDTIATLNDIETRYSNPKYKNAFGLSGAWRAQQAKDHPIAYAPFDNEITLVRQDVEMLRQKYAKAMEGGRMSDSDRAFYQNVLMSQNLSYENFLEGVRRLKASEEKALQRRITNYGLQGKNVNEFENLYNTGQTQTQTPAEGTIIKNKQGQKMIMRGGQWQAI